MIHNNGDVRNVHEKFAILIHIAHAEEMMLTKGIGIRSRNSSKGFLERRPPAAFPLFKVRAVPKVTLNIPTTCLGYIAIRYILCFDLSTFWR